MPEGHPYRALAEGAYRPAHAADDERWELARRGAERILAADAPLAEDDRGYVASERNALCALCYWAARDGEEALCPDALLDEATIQRFVADDGPTRRVSHRSRVALASLNLPPLAGHLRAVCGGGWWDGEGLAGPAL
jgi:hypothetical protein